MTRQIEPKHPCLQENLCAPSRQEHGTMETLCHNRAFRVPFLLVFCQVQFSADR
jgi:hypothetical protein